MSTSIRTKSKLPTEGRPLRLDPDLAEALEEILAPLAGKRLEAAQKAITRVRNSGTIGTFGEILAGYRAAIEKAVDAGGDAE